MAEKKDGWSRFREREEKRVEEERKNLHEQMRKIDPEAKIGEKTTADKILIDLIGKCEVLMEQITNLYGMWIQGFERTPPITQRSHLDDLVLKIRSSAQPSANLRFRIAEFNTKYSTYKDKWDRILKDVESGKITVKRKSISG